MRHVLGWATPVSLALFLAFFGIAGCGSQPAYHHSLGIEPPDRGLPRVVEVCPTPGDFGQAADFADYGWFECSPFQDWWKYQTVYARKHSLMCSTGFKHVAGKLIEIQVVLDGKVVEDRSFRASGPNQIAFARILPREISATPQPLLQQGRYGCKMLISGHLHRDRTFVVR